MSETVTDDQGEEWTQVTIDPEDVKRAMHGAINVINEAIERGEKGGDVKLQALTAAMGVFIALIADGQYDLVAGALRMVGKILENNNTAYAAGFAQARLKAN